MAEAGLSSEELDNIAARVAELLKGDQDAQAAEAADGKGDQDAQAASAASATRTTTPGPKHPPPTEAAPDLEEAKSEPPAPTHWSSGGWDQWKGAHWPGSARQSGDWTAGEWSTGDW